MLKYSARSLMMWANFSARCLGHRVQIMDSIKCQEIKKGLTAYAVFLVMGCVCLIFQDKYPKQTLKSTYKIGQ